MVDTDIEYMEIPGMFKVYTSLWDEEKKRFYVRITDGKRNLLSQGYEPQLLENNGFTSSEVRYIGEYLNNNKDGLLCNSQSNGGWVQRMFDIENEKSCFCE